MDWALPLSISDAESRKRTVLASETQSFTISKSNRLKGSGHRLMLPLFTVFSLKLLIGRTQVEFTIMKVEFILAMRIQICYLLQTHFCNQTFVHWAVYFIWMD